MGIGLDPDHRAQAAPVGVDQTLGFQPGQPDPTKPPDLFQVLQAAIPTVEDHALRREPPRVCGLQQRLKMIGYCWRNQASGKELPETGANTDKCGINVSLDLPNTLTAGMEMALIRIRQQYPVVC